MRDHKIGSILTTVVICMLIIEKNKGEESPEKSVCKTTPKVHHKQSQTLNF